MVAAPTIFVQHLVVIAVSVFGTVVSAAVSTAVGVWITGKLRQANGHIHDLEDRIVELEARNHPERNP